MVYSLHGDADSQIEKDWVRKIQSKVFIRIYEKTKQQLKTGKIEGNRMLRTVNLHFNRGIRLNSIVIIITLAILLVITLSWISSSSTSSSSASSASWKVFHQINNQQNHKLTTQSKNHNQQKYLVRDWSVYLGWNNFRYTVETGLLLAKLLNRTLVLPAFTYSRACEYEDQECTNLTPILVNGMSIDLAALSNRTWYPDPKPGSKVITPDLYLQYGKGWVLPIEKMLDVDHIISTWGHAIKLPDFHKLTNPDPGFYSIGVYDGKWNTDFNLDLSYRKMPNSMFTNFSLSMVDKLPSPIKPLIDRSKPIQENSALITQCESTLKILESSIPKRDLDHQSKRTAIPDVRLPNWDESEIRGSYMVGKLAENDNLLLESCFASNGFRSAYGYGMLGWWMKAPYEPIKNIKRLQNMRGWWDELHKFDEQILHIEGELHNGFPPGQMMWTSKEGRLEFERLVRSSMRPPQWYHNVAARLEKRMRARCGGRSWVGAHMRRGDFLAFEWAANNITNQWSEIKTHTLAGANLLQSRPDLLKPTNQQFGTSLEPPHVDDPIYIATNIRKKDEVDYLRTKNIVLLSDLLEESDRLELGFSGKFMDTTSILEQCLLMRSGYFYGDAHSSVDGWILNRRVFYGISEEVTKIEYLKLPGDGK
ncbi:hypothetical protein Pst134EA_000149 [Puccinia striiformis f. sp. tritici]|uniref:hypothetical protein n=1 Tax=Puccinia striiformis f. sp. tritici TaxID=168172 RepID=UPI0020079A2C|nr:hypothetical protein Pst134EA_000149 [Puccinia striiformis f. sp. tritici]KAH9473069.1 hypothetical protein Pst134EA_000149 [Puccinia striiformis f. sp. tritici]KAI9607536.1 hypothetical protein KEM48_001546 [Puccinia striiformis f. sp. tritici PST-130]